jgi:uncharacterized protein (TIGR02145 family)
MRNSLALKFLLINLISLSMLPAFSQSEVKRLEEVGNRRMITLDVNRVADELSALLAAQDLTASDVTALTTALSGLTWADVLSNGSTSNSDVSLGNNDLSGVSTLTVALISGDSMVVAKVIDGRIGSLSNHTTDGLAEGALNRYFTDARADGRIAAASATDLSDISSAGSGAIITTAERTKLEGLSAGAEANVNADWAATTGDAQILNKPTLSTVAISGNYSDLTGSPSTITEAERSTLSNLLHSVDSLSCTWQKYHGHVYKLILIGDQCWFAENLQSDRYANGDEIPGDLNGTDWINTTSGAQAVHGEGLSNCEGNCDEIANLAKYGRLYNWYAVVDSRGLCPGGWHVPSDEEITDLTNFIGGEPSGAPVLKSSPSDTPNWEGTNTTGFSALPGGNRNGANGDFYFVDQNGYWWSSSPNGLSNSWYRLLISGLDDVLRGSFDQGYGFSVRCVRD